MMSLALKTIIELESRLTPFNLSLARQHSPNRYDYVNYLVRCSMCNVPEESQDIMSDWLQQELNFIQQCYPLLDSEKQVIDDWQDEDIDFSDIELEDVLIPDEHLWYTDVDGIQRNFRTGLPIVVVGTHEGYLP